MDPEHERQRLLRVRRNQVLVDPHRLLRVHVDPLHEPARIVRPNRNHHEIEWAVSSADVIELRMVGRIGSEEDAFPPHLEREPAPQCLIAIAEPSGTEVSGGNGRDAEVAHDRVVPPVQLDDRARAPPADVGPESKRDDPRRVRVSPSQLPDRWLIEMIVVAVREQNDVQWRKVIDRHRRIHDAARTGPLNGERSLTEDRVREDVESPGL